MNAEELYTRSHKAHFGTPRTNSVPGLSERVVRRLIQAGYVRTTADHKCVVVREALLKAVLNGTIWELRLIGEKSVREICEWLVDN